MPFRQKGRLESGQSLQGSGDRASGGPDAQLIATVLRITVSTLMGLVASGSSRERILQAYQQLEPADIDEALAYAAWRIDPSVAGRRP